MNEYTYASRQLAHRLPPGDHRLDNTALRNIYGISRVTPKARDAIAVELHRSGLQVLDDPSREPLVVRKVVLQQVRPPSSPQRGRDKRVIGGALVAAVLFLIIVAIAAGPGSDDEGGGAPQEQPTQEPLAATEDPAPPAQTREDAIRAVADDDYEEAMVIAAVLGEDDESYIARRIAGRLARRTLRALRSGNRSEARVLLREAKEYPTTSLTRTAKTRYIAAERLADERRQIRADQREARRQARADARAQKRARRRAEAAAADPPADSESSAPDTSGPSTSNWCGKRDGDGDGIYCEGE